jgi:hypothetical protein
MKIKCSIAIVTFFLIATTCALSADWKSSNGMSLLNACESFEKITNERSDINLEEASDATYCAGLVSGISSTQIIYSDELPKNNKLKVCWPKGTNNAQNIKVVLKYLRDHPAELHLPGTLLIFKAFLEAYGCT